MRVRFSAVVTAAVVVAVCAAAVGLYRAGFFARRGAGADVSSSTPAAAAGGARADASGQPAGDGGKELAARLAELCGRASGEVGVAVTHVETGRTAECNGAKPLPLFSVFKLPLAVAVLKDVEEGRLRLDQKVRVQPAEVVAGSRENTALWGKTTERTVAELLEVSIARSDNTSSDKLLALVGGPAAVTARMRSLGLRGVEVRSTVREFLAKPESNNTGAANDLARLLALLRRGEALNAEHTSLLVGYMARATTGMKRLRAGVPAGTPVADKTGTGGVGGATNDVGLITLPAGRGHLAVAVLINGSKLPADEQEKLIADIARAAYEAHAK